MKFLKISLAAISIGLFSISGVQAGSGTLRHSDGSKVKIKCSSGGCFETFTDAAGNKSKPKNVGAGGRQNYVKHKNKWKTKGYK